MGFVASHERLLSRGAAGHGNDTFRLEIKASGGKTLIPKTAASCISIYILDEQDTRRDSIGSRLTAALGQFYFEVLPKSESCPFERL